MKSPIAALLFSLVPGVLVTSLAFAQTPAGSTGECKDGTYTSVASKRGACAGHKGVKAWYEAKTSDAPAVVPAPAAVPVAPASKGKAAAPSGMPTAAAAGGGVGKVWVNSASKVYHCNGSKWYGLTKKGEYLSEAEAKAKGAHADHGKACG